MPEYTEQEVAKWQVAVDTLTSQVTKLLAETAELKSAPKADPEARKAQAAKLATMETTLAETRTKLETAEAKLAKLEPQSPPIPPEPPKRRARPDAWL